MNRHNDGDQFAPRVHEPATTDSSESAHPARGEDTPPTTRRAKLLVAIKRARIGHPCYWWHASGFISPVRDWPHHKDVER